CNHLSPASVGALRLLAGIPVSFRARSAGAHGSARPAGLRRALPVTATPAAEGSLPDFTPSPGCRRPGHPQIAERRNQDVERAGHVHGAGRGILRDDTREVPNRTPRRDVVVKDVNDAVTRAVVSAHRSDADRPQDDAALAGPRCSGATLVGDDE